MPTLLQINSTANWGSTGKIAEQIGVLAIRNGWKSYIAYGRYANKSQSHLIKIGSKWSQLWHLIESRLLDNHGLSSRLATKRLIRQVAQIKPDIIHLHNIHGYYLNYKLLFEYLNRANIPVVWTLHDCWPFTGHCSHFVNADCMKWQTECSACYHMGNYPKAYIDRSSRNFYLKEFLFNSLEKRLTIVPVSNWLQNYVKYSFLQRHKIQTIHNGVDVSVFKPHDSGENIHKSTKILLGVASAWSKSKGLDDFIALREMLPSDVVIKLVGLTKEQIAKMPSGIIGIERTSCVEELVNLYAEADVFVNPTYADTFPTVNLEALACGTPVVTYHTGGSPESVTPNTGFVVEQGNLNELKNAIMSILNKGKKLYVEACRNRAVEHFDKDKCFAQYIKLYERILNDK